MRPISDPITSALTPAQRAELRALPTPDLQAELEWSATEIADLEERLRPLGPLAALHPADEELAWWGLYLEQRAEHIKGELERRLRLGVALRGPTFSREWIWELKERIALHELIALMHDGTALKLTGGHYVGLCPWHVERSASLHVWVDHYHCFGCHEHGDVFDWLLKAACATWREAVEYAARYAGVALPVVGIRGIEIPS